MPEPTEPKEALPAEPEKMFTNQDELYTDPDALRSLINGAEIVRGLDGNSVVDARHLLRIDANLFSSANFVKNELPVLATYVKEKVKEGEDTLGEVEKGIRDVQGITHEITERMQRVIRVFEISHSDQGEVEHVTRMLESAIDEAMGRNLPGKIEALKEQSGNIWNMTTNEGITEQASRLRRDIEIKSQAPLAEITSEERDSFIENVGMLTNRDEKEAMAATIANGEAFVQKMAREEELVYTARRVTSNLDDLPGSARLRNELEMISDLIRRVKREGYSGRMQNSFLAEIQGRTSQIFKKTRESLDDAAVAVRLTERDFARLRDLAEQY